MDEVIIVMRYGLKYRKARICWQLVCAESDCIKNALIQGGGFYCVAHYKELDDKENTIKNLRENYKKTYKMENDAERNKERDNLEQQIINGVTVYFKNNKKYRLCDNDNFGLVCIYDMCSNFAGSKHDHNYYCSTHRKGSDPTSIERLNERELVKIKRKEKGNHVLVVGNSTEQWIFDMMKLFDTINSIKRVGNERNKLDIIYKVNGEDLYRGIQVKTLTKGARDGYYMHEGPVKYHENTVIVGVDQTKTKFALFYKKEIKLSNISFSFGNGRSKHKDFIFTSPLKFLNKLEQMLQNSCFYDGNDISKVFLQEKNHLIRLNKKCDDLKLEFALNNEITAIDCFINNYNIQCKTTNNLQYNLYNAVIVKSGGRVNSKRTQQPYSDKDNIDFFIFEIMDYQNFFYIIPIDIMIQKGFIKTNIQTGKHTVSLPNPTLKSDHWAKKYINNFDLLKTNKLGDHLKNQLSERNLSLSYASCAKIT